MLAAVAVGGRTGLTAIFNALFFALALPLAPVFGAVPEFASAPVLVLLGVDLLSLTKFLDLDDGLYALPSFCTIALMPYLYSIDHAVIAGLVAYWALQALNMAAEKCAGRRVGDEPDGACGAPEDGPSSGETAAITSAQVKEPPLAAPLLDDETKHDAETGGVGADDAASDVSDASRQRTGVALGYEEYYASRGGGYLVGGAPARRLDRQRSLLTALPPGVPSLPPGGT